tara:strand:+ start:1359 stop:1718 length:360 start_codon:yes stop_codon:yes gene_type:complete
MNIALKYGQAFIHFLTQTKELYDVYMTHGKRYKDALNLFEVDLRFLEFVTQILKKIDSNSIDHSDLASLANYLISWKRKFLMHQRSQLFKSNETFFFVSNICFPSQSIDNFLSRLGSRA